MTSPKGKMPDAIRYLTRDKARAFYDRFGVRQDWQRFYEGPALRDLLLHGDFKTAQSVFELGCGTGYFAKILLEDYLPETASYVGVDISPTMAGIAGKRLALFGGRVKLVVTDGALAFDYADGSFDRFVANYVMDLLSPGDILQTLDEASRILKPGGFLCLVSLTRGRSMISRALTWAWNRIFVHDPRLVGGCRPVELAGHLDKGRWRVEHHLIISAFGLPSEVLVASRLAD